MHKRIIMAVFIMLAVSAQVRAESVKVASGIAEILTRVDFAPAGYDGYFLGTKLAGQKGLSCKDAGRCSFVVNCDEATSKRPQEVVCNPTSLSHVENGPFKVKSVDLIFRDGLLSEIWETMDADPAAISGTPEVTQFDFDDPKYEGKFSVNKAIGRGVLVVRQRTTSSTGR